MAARREGVVYWVVPPGGKVRHGITDKPGKWPAGTEVAALCGNDVKIPQPTPYPATPRSASITTQCPDCVTEYRRRDSPSTVWDF
ncbi:zinc finger protein [Saccharopolyspora sp. 5N708]|uniref:zinc finger protein n=1 Tax=Saccharopolyspora sp. 5N708 TaxID=3457424 RepID=UPI003FD08CE3